MNYSKFRITLDIHRHQSQVSIPVMYGDTAVQLLVTLTDGGLPYVIGKSCWAQFVAVKPGSSDPLLRKCIIENGTVIRLDFDEGIADVAGVYDCEIRLYGAEGKITSPCFTMVVDPRIAADYVGDGTENNFIDQIGTTMASFASAEEAREDAEAAREDAEAERVKAEEERQAANNSLVADVSFEVFDDGSIILHAFDSTGNEVSQSCIESIGTDTIADQAVTSKKIAPGAVKSSHLAQYAVGSYELADGAVTEEKLDSALSDRLTRFGETDRDLDRRISLIEEHLEGASFVTDESVAYEKAVPARACSSAKLLSLGGMTHKCKNLLDSTTINFFGNATVTNGVVTQTKADTNPSPYMKCLTFDENDFVAQTIAGTIQIGRLGVAFEKTTEIKSIRFGLNGSTVDTMVGTDVTHLPNGTYYLSVNFTNITQGSISWRDMMINEGSTALPYEPFYEGLRDSKVTEIRNRGANLIPFPYTWGGAGTVKEHNGITFTVREDRGIHIKGKTTSYSYFILLIGAELGTTFGSAANSSTNGEYSIRKYMFYNAANKSLSINFDNPSKEYDEVIYPMLNKGATIAPYKPYREPISYPIPAEIQAIEGYGKDGFNIDLVAQESDYNGDKKPLPVPFGSIIKVEGGGSLEFVNEYKNPVPSAVKYLLKEESAV